jgi:hypothetical protein
MSDDYITPGMDNVGNFCSKSSIHDSKRSKMFSIGSLAMVPLEQYDEGGKDVE